MTLSDLSIRRPVFASMLSLALVLFGALGYQRLTVRELPDIDPPIVSVSTTLRGANPRVMESSVTDILEEELSTLEGLRTMTSSSGEQSSNIVLEFTLDRDVETAAQDVRDKVSRVRGRLPLDIEEPVIAKQDADAQPFFYLSLSAPGVDRLELSDVADRVVKQRLQTIPGVGRANVLGERKYAMRVWLDANALAARGLTVQDVAQAIRTRNVEVPAGRIESSQREFTVRSLGELRTPQEFADVVVSNADGIPVKVRDLARVELGAESERSLFRFDGNSSVGIGIVRQSKANQLEVSEAIYAALPEIQAALPPGMLLQPAFDGSEFVRRSITEAQRTLLEAAVLVVVIIFLFLRNLRATLIPAFAIPTSIVAVFAIMFALGYSINNFTLLALTIAIGIVVDDAIIVLENAYRHQEELGKDPETAAREGTREIGFAVIATTASLIAVFVPLAFLQGNTGRLFNEFGLALAGAVFLSGFVALTLTPMLCARILRVPTRHGRTYQALERGFTALADAYARLLARAIRHPALVLLGSAGLVVGAWLAFGTLKREFIPADDRGILFGAVIAPEGATLDYTDRYQSEAERILLAEPGVQHVFSAVGRGGSPNGGFMGGLLDPIEERTDDAETILARLRPKLGGIAGAFVFLQNPPAIGGFGAPLQYIVRHPNYDSLVVANERLLAAARQVGGLVNVDTDLKLNKPELTIAYDRDRAEDLGVPVSDIAGTLQTMLGGTRAGTFTRENKLFDVLLQLDPGKRATPSDMDNLFMRGRGGALIRLDALAGIEETTGPRAISHYQRVRNFTLTAAVTPTFTLGEAIDTLDAVTAAQLPPGTTIALAGQARELQESGNELLFAFGLAILVVFMVLAVQFESLVHPFTVLMAVPLAVIGAIFTLTLAGATVNLYSQIGMILLVGLVTKNSILLVEYANQLRERGLERIPAILEAGRIRFRPILMTTVATIMGALPIAIGIGAGSASRRPLGYAIVGGVAFSAVMTLLVVPVVWALLEGLRERRRVPAESTVLAPSPAAK
ncbi:MAG TPA: efflux RND transporter permease subunit [Gemmatimonadales bacterium]|nr:efflux RND transporter permease subunit [Gemmatimonadales bacterium]MCB9518131.1 efflux RND transporter permease subunit [Gemmatimonadales bacterium]HPF60722.1 efflux RND transporter permease subunit [Gemmatimonadales bacterium]HRX17475.1 efflux RND transporter permease subunit [Gemmatimonadales bacterium]